MASLFDLRKEFEGFALVDQFPDIGCIEHDFDGGDASLSGGHGEESLADNALESEGEFHADLLMEIGGEEVDDAFDGLDGVDGVESGEDEVSGLCGGDGGLHCLNVAHFADEDDVWRLPHDVFQGFLEGLGVETDFALADDGHLVLMEEFYGVLDGDDVAAAIGVDVVDHRGQGGGLSGAGCAGDEDEAARFLGEFAYGVGEVEVGEGEVGVGDMPEDKSNGSALSEDVDAEAPKSADADGEVHFGCAFEALDLFLGHEAVGEFLYVVDGEFAVVEGLNEAVDADEGGRAGLDKQVGRRAFDHIVKEIVELNG